MLTLAFVEVTNGIRVLPRILLQVDALLLQPSHLPSESRVRKPKRVLVRALRVDLRGQRKIGKRKISPSAPCGFIDRDNRERVTVRRQPLPGDAQDLAIARVQDVAIIEERFAQQLDLSGRMVIAAGMMAAPDSLSTAMTYGVHAGQTSLQPDGSRRSAEISCALVAQQLSPKRTKPVHLGCGLGDGQSRGSHGGKSPEIS